MASEHKTHTSMTVRITFLLDASMNPGNLLEELQWAINTACTQLEQRLPTGRSISYRLGDTFSDIYTEDSNDPTS